MTKASRRRRAVVLLSLALASGGLAASEVESRTQEVEQRVGAPVPVLVARDEVERDTELTRGRLERLFEIREVPERYVPSDSFASAEDVEGLTTSVPLAAGSYLTAGHLGAEKSGEDGGDPALGRGERAVEVAVAGGLSLTAGARADVLVSTEPSEGAGRTSLALENVELLDVRQDDGAAGTEDKPAASTVATLRVTPRQAVFLTAAQNYAREVRLLPRAPGDRGRVGEHTIEAGGL